MGIYQSDFPPDFAYVPGGSWCKIKQIVNEKVKRISAVTVRSHKRKSITGTRRNVILFLFTSKFPFLISEINFLKLRLLLIVEILCI